MCNGILAVDNDLYMCLLVRINAHHSLMSYLAYSNIQQLGYAQKSLPSACWRQTVCEWVIFEICVTENGPLDWIVGWKISQVNQGCALNIGPATSPEAWKISSILCTRVACFLICALQPKRVKILNLYIVLLCTHLYHFFRYLLTIYQGVQCSSHLL